MRIAALFLVFASTFAGNAAHAVTVYGEDFTGQEGWGIGGNGTANTGNGESWIVSSSADGTETDFSGIDAQDYFRVDDGAMEVRDADQIVYWISPVVSIADYTDLNLTATFQEVGDHEAFGGSGGDFVNVEVSLDGGATFALLSNINGFGSSTVSLTGDIPNDADWGSTILSENLADGTAFQLRVALQNTANGEYLGFDDIQLTGNLVTSIPLPASGLLLAGALGVLVRRRRAW